jgi:hypothetical protein
MANIKFGFDLSGGEDSNGVVRFEPGSRLAGVATVLPGEPINFRQMVVRVGWHTEGKGGRDQQIVGELPFPQSAGQLAPNVPLSQAFAVDLPRNPWSFAGHLITIVWTVRVFIDVPLGENIVGIANFVLAPKR